MLRLVFQDFAYLKAAISEAVRRSPGSAIESSVRDQNFVLWFELVVCCPRLAGCVVPGRGDDDLGVALERRRPA